MVEICSIAFEIETLADVLVWPTGCFYYFWLLILGFVFLFLTYTFYEKDELKKTEGEMISSMGVASLVTSMLAVFGTFIANNEGVPMIQTDILLWVIAPTIVLLSVWFYNK